MWHRALLPPLPASRQQPGLSSLTDEDALEAYLVRCSDAEWREVERDNLEVAARKGPRLTGNPIWDAMEREAWAEGLEDADDA